MPNSRFTNTKIVFFYKNSLTSFLIKELNLESLIYNKGVKWVQIIW